MIAAAGGDGVPFAFVSLTLVVMAAGMGSRYGGLKQVEPIGPDGETLLDYSLFDALRAGFDRLVFVIRRDIEEAFAPIAARYASRVSVELAFQELDVGVGDHRVVAGRTKPWGTGQAVLAAAPLVDGPFGAVNADDFYGAGAFRSLAAFLATARPTGPVNDYAMVAYRLGATLSEHGTVARGVCKTKGDLLVGIEEVTSIGKGRRGIETPAGRRFTGDEPVSLNVWGFDPTIFHHLQAKFSAFLAASGADPKAEFFLPSVVAALINEDGARVHVLRSEGSWFGVTYREDKDAVARSIGAMVGAGAYPTPLWSG